MEQQKLKSLKPFFQLTASATIMSSILFAFSSQAHANMFTVKPNTSPLSSERVGQEISPLQETIEKKIGMYTLSIRDFKVLNMQGVQIGTINGNVKVLGTRSEFAPDSVPDKVFLPVSEANKFVGVYDGAYVEMGALTRFSLQVVTPEDLISGTPQSSEYLALANVLSKRDQANFSTIFKEGFVILDGKAINSYGQEIPNTFISISK